MKAGEGQSPVFVQRKDLPDIFGKIYLKRRGMNSFRADGLNERSEELPRSIRSKTNVGIRGGALHVTMQETAFSI